MLMAVLKRKNHVPVFKKSILALAVMGICTIVNGQETDVQTADTADVEIVEGKGMRGSLFSAQALKRNATTVVDSIHQLEDSKSSRVLVVAHRTCWRNAPENTLQAIEHCIKVGVDMVEIDVRKTKDGELVVIHDETLDRTTNGAGLV
jgi:hypothetical protein